MKLRSSIFARSIFSLFVFSALTSIAFAQTAPFNQSNPFDQTTSKPEEIIGAKISEQGNPSVEAFLKKGVVVESVIKNQEGEQAGIQPGDVLLGWSRGDEAGEINSPFDLPYVRTEQASRGPLKLMGFRDSEKHSWLLGSDLWGVWTYPNFQGELLSIYKQGQKFARAGRLDVALEQWRKAAAFSESAEVPWISPWLLSRAARIYGERWREDGNLDRQDDLYRRAIEQASGTGSEVRADLLRQRAEACQRRGDFAHFEEYQEERLLELRKLGDKMPAVDALTSLAWVTGKRGEILKEENYAREALMTAQTEAPKSIETILALYSVSSVLMDEGNLAQATNYDQQALDNLKRYYLKRSRFALILGHLGTLASRRGDLAKAEAYFRRALAITEQAYPNNVAVSDPLSRLAECLIDQGDVADAERYELRSLALRQKYLPGNLAVA